MRRQRDITDIIQTYIRPLLNSECRRLGMPPSFVRNVRGVYPKHWEFNSVCRSIGEDGSSLQGGGEVACVEIGIDSTIRTPSRGLMDFWHEIYHAKEFYRGKRRTSEFKATLYSWRRLFEECLRQAASLLH